MDSVIRLCASYRTQEAKDLLLRELEGMKHLRISRIPRKEYGGNGKSSSAKIYLELSIK